MHMQGEEKEQRAWAEGGVPRAAAASPRGVARVCRKPAQWFLRRRKALRGGPFCLRCQQVGGVSQNRGVRDSAMSRPQVTLNFAT